MANVSLQSMSVNLLLSAVQPNGSVLVPNNLKPKDQFLANFASGTGALDVNRLVYMRIPIVLSGTQAIDVNAGTYTDGTNTGSLVDENGTAVTFARIKALMLYLVDEVGGPTVIHINAAATNAIGLLGGKAKAKGDGTNGTPGELVWVDGSAAGEVVDGTHKVISIVNESALAGHFDIWIAGCNA